MEVFDYQCGCKDTLVMTESIVEKSASIDEIKKGLAKFRDRLYGTKRI